MSKEHYFNYPLSLMQYIKNDTDKEGLLKIIAFAVMNFSEKVGYRKNSVASQIIYLYYRKDYFLSKKLNNYLSEMFDDGRLIEDEDYHGFANDTFLPEQEIEGILSEFESNNDFYSQCVIVYQEHQAMSLLNLNPVLISDIRNQYQKITKFIESFEKKNGRDAWTSVSNDLIFKVYNGELSMDYFRLVSAGKSVLNKKNFNLSYKSVLLCRMFGCKKMQILTDLFAENPDLQLKHAFLSRRRQWEKLIDSAMNQGFISYYSTGRQFFVSVTMTKDELQNAVNLNHENRPKFKINT
jgi:hypothetical protein